MILNVLFILSILFSGIYSFINFREFMDAYEVAILVFSVPVFIWLGYFWSSFRKLFLAIFFLTIVAVMIFQNDLQVQETNFFLRYFLSSQSMIMWMTFFFPLSLASYLYSSIKSNQFSANLGSNFSWIALTTGFTGLMVRWYESYLISPDVGHIPISNLYEVFVLFCLITGAMYLYYEQKSQTKKLGSFVLIIINTAVAFILWYTFAKNADAIQPLVPALQSYWMKIHVPTNFIGYGAFSISAMIAVAYLLRNQSLIKNILPSEYVMEDLMYKSIAIGFIFFTIATILGAIWAAEAWGGYWSWDPKETWALIVWLNYAAWLHLRLVKGLRGDILAWWSVIGLLITTFAFIGVNLFLSGLHSYGEL
jgi:cytochrome c-type biogenesis protein CcsB